MRKTLVLFAAVLGLWTTAAAANPSDYHGYPDWARHALSSKGCGGR